MLRSIARGDRDPFDRLLIAQATLEQLPLLTNDAEIKRYDVPVVW